MYDFEKLIYKTIKDIGAKAVYGYPTDWNTLPIIDYVEGTFSDPTITINDRKTRSFEVQYFVDVWSHDPKEMSSLGEQAINNLEKAGFHVTSLGQVQDPYDTTIFHLRLSAQAHWDKVENTLY